MKQNDVHFTDYMVLEGQGGAELSEQVVAAIHNGWQPYGDMQLTRMKIDGVVVIKLFQPMVQKAEWYR